MFKSVVVSEPIEVDARLQVLGLTTSLLSEAIQRGHLARMSCTANDPIGAAGYAGWSHTVRALRDLLVPLGWRRNEDEQLPLTINEANTVAIAVSHGIRPRASSAAASPARSTPKDRPRPPSWSKTPPSCNCRSAATSCSCAPHEPSPTARPGSSCSIRRPRRSAPSSRCPRFLAPVATF